MNWINVVGSAIVMSIGLYYIVKNISKENFTRKNILLFIPFMSILLVFNLIFFKGITRVFFSFLFIFLACYTTLFNKKLNKSIYYAFVYVILSDITEVILTVIMLTCFKYSMDTYNNFEYSLLLFSTMNTIVNCLLSKCNFFQNIIRKNENKLANNHILKIYIVIFAVTVALLITNNYINYKKSLSYYINFAMLIFVIITTVIIIYNKLKNDKLEKDYNTMLEYVSKYEKIINEQGKKNHEYNNQLMVLNGYINNPKMLKEYLSNIIKEQKGGKNYTIEQLSYFPDGGIKGLIYHKLSKMDEYKVRPYLYIDKETKDIFETSFDINTYRDITKLFGVFLDNAIEAASKAEKREVEIDMHKKDDYLIVIIGNTFDKSVEVDKIGKSGFTTKGVGHGYGLSIVKDISKNNSKIETFNNIDCDLFKQTIMIDLK